MNWQIGISEEYPGRLTVAMLEEGKQLGHISMISAEAENLISVLIQFRTQMKPEITRDLPAVSILNGVRDPLFAIFDLPDLPGKGFAVRHDGIGWLSFLFADSFAASIGAALLDRSVRRPINLNPTQH